MIELCSQIVFVQQMIDVKDIDMNCAIFGVQCNVGTSPGWGALGCPAANIVQPGDNGVKDDNYNDKGDNIVQSGIVWLITQYFIIVPKNIQ